MSGTDYEVFDEDCRPFFAIHHEFPEGVEGGESDVRLDRNGNRGRGGRPQRNEVQSSMIGIAWRNKYRDEIQRQGLIRPHTNWYRNRNRVMTSGN